MAHEIRVTLNIEVDGQSLPDMPLIRRALYAELASPIVTATADKNATTFHGIAAATMAALNFFYLSTDQALNLQINQSGTSAPLPLNAGSVVLIMSPNLTQGTPTNNITYNNPAASASANLSILVAGT